MSINSHRVESGAKVANFFWEGSALGPVETGCIASFLKGGFKVFVYSYRNLRLPLGVELRDASAILPEAMLGKFCQAGNNGNLAAFSDAFRYRLLERRCGWWFDADMLCIGNSGEFEALLTGRQPAFCAGLEDDEHINGAALYAADDQVIQALMSDMAACGYTFDWGEIGPKLLTRVVDRLDLRRVIEPLQTFYPIHYRDFTKLYDPEQRDWCEVKVSGSLALHLWNEIRSRLAIPSVLLPPTKSFLHERLISASAELRSAPTLNVETFRRLVQYSMLKEQVAGLLDFEERVKNSLPYRMRKKLLRLAGQ